MPCTVSTCPAHLPPLSHQLLQWDARASPVCHFSNVPLCTCHPLMKVFIDALVHGFVGGLCCPATFLRGVEACCRFLFSACVLVLSTCLTQASLKHRQRACLREPCVLVPSLAAPHHYLASFSSSSHPHMLPILCGDRSGTANNAGAILVLGRDLVVFPKMIHPLPPTGNSNTSSPDGGQDDTWMAVSAFPHASNHVQAVEESHCFTMAYTAWTVSQLCVRLACKKALAQHLCSAVYT